jgi:lipid-A-disaccharide synthase
MTMEECFNKTPEKVWIFAGETSGDLFGAYLAKRLIMMQPGIQLSCMGGSEMKAAGVDIMVDSTELGVMGLVEVLKLYPKFKRIFNNLVERARNERPDVVVLIDYPGFNLRFAAKMKTLGIKVVYYVSPQIWAWKKGRAPKIAHVVDHMMVIFPFEKDLYKKYDLPTTFIGHPLVEILKRGDEAGRDPNLILLLPGSRNTEISRIFPTMYRCAEELKKRHPALRFVTLSPRATIADKLGELIAQLKSTDSDLEIERLTGQNDDLMRTAAVAIAASGTVTVQCAMLGLPLVSVYRVNPITHFFMKRLVTISYFTMVNIITDRLVYEEFSQGDYTVETVVPAIERILPDGPRRAEVLRGMVEAVSELGRPQPASRNAAEIVLSVASQASSEQA